ncbi:hypothetical protein FA95DRAFT_1566644 [Auriscalpium vulgare]|uniref:Uncharacterized protein n=1 Tax=Auriscalpium vulgare TaxID=40419 RepID=A0ACB8R801_9AGAM|nr:hypothetical protein FA95DRAFT_1566644 [Auriscalpium vulgare]
MAHSYGRKTRRTTRKSSSSNRATAVKCNNKPDPRFVTMNAQQRSMLFYFFRLNAYPNAEQKQEIADIISCSYKKVHHWFSNKRQDIVTYRKTKDPLGAVLGRLTEAVQLSEKDRQRIAALANSPPEPQPFFTDDERDMLRGSQGTSEPSIAAASSPSPAASPSPVPPTVTPSPPSTRAPSPSPSAAPTADFSTDAEMVASASAFGRYCTVCRPPPAAPPLMSAAFSGYIPTKSYTFSPVQWDRGGDDETDEEDELNDEHAPSRSECTSSSAGAMEYQGWTVLPAPASALQRAPSLNAEDMRAAALLTELTHGPSTVYRHSPYPPVDPQYGAGYHYYASYYPRAYYGSA